MKCPKCGYTSFESYDSCRKCSTDLVEFKQTYGLTPVILPAALCASLVAELGNGQTAGDTQSDNSSDMFSFDMPTEQQAAAPSATAVSAGAQAFSFDTPPAAPQSDPFASLMEAAPQTSKPAASQAAAGQAFELNNFSWDDTPTPGQPGSTSSVPSKSEDDDFNSLFGDLGTSDKK
jgi:hypothetical protein